MDKKVEQKTKQTDKPKKDKSQNPMRKIKIEKVLLSVGLKESGEPVERVFKLVKKNNRFKPDKDTDNKKCKDIQVKKRS